MCHGPRLIQRSYKWPERLFYAVAFGYGSGEFRGSEGEPRRRHANQFAPCHELAAGIRNTTKAVASKGAKPAIANAGKYEK